MLRGNGSSGNSKTGKSSNGGGKAGAVCDDQGVPIGVGDIVIDDHLHVGVVTEVHNKSNVCHRLLWGEESGTSDHGIYSMPADQLTVIMPAAQRPQGGGR